MESYILHHSFNHGMLFTLSTKVFFFYIEDELKHKYH